jgi:broad specificity phosphatase PhoE
MPTTILLIRHGETDWNRDKRYRGGYDVPLNDNGRQHARIAAQAVRSEPIDAAYSSPLCRALETATIVLGPHGLTPVPHDGLRDIDYGDWTGLPEAEVVRRWPEEHAQWLANPHTLRIPGGDRLVEVYERAFTAMEAIAQQHEGQLVALFAHRVVNKLLILGALGLGVERFPFILQGNCCINRFTRLEEGYLIECLNETAHMRASNVALLGDDF